MNDRTGDPAKARHEVRLPGFLVEGEIGLGALIERATSAVGIAPCEGCRRRAERLDRWMTFTRR